jgi:hypothetical protein
MADQYVRLICGAFGSDPPLPLHGMAPTPLSLPDSFHGAPAGVRTKALLGRAPLPIEPFVAAGPVATMVEKTEV